MLARNASSPAVLLLPADFLSILKQADTFDTSEAWTTESTHHLQSDLPELTNNEISLDHLKLAEHVFEYDRRQSSVSKTQSLTITGPEVALSTVNERDDTEAEHQDPPVVVVK